MGLYTNTNFCTLGTTPNLTNPGYIVYNFYVPTRETCHGQKCVPSGSRGSDRTASFGGASVERGLDLGQAQRAPAGRMGEAALSLRQPLLRTAGRGLRRLPPLGRAAIPTGEHHRGG